MDHWLRDDIKELFARPCMNVAGTIGARMDNRLRNLGQEIDERALTEDLVDALDTESTVSTWRPVIQSLRDHQIFIHSRIRKSTYESRTGADIGFLFERQIFEPAARSRARYAALVQCKRVSRDGKIRDFFHKVKSSGRKQSELMLDITPASYYFIFVPPSMLRTYSTIEPMGFVAGSQGCSSPVWNIGCFG